MRALKYTVHIGADHQVHVEVPPETPPGRAEVIVLIQEPVRRGESLLALLDGFAQRPGPHRSRGEIEARLAAERASWDD